MQQLHFNGTRISQPISSPESSEMSHHCLTSMFFGRKPIRAQRKYAATESVMHQHSLLRHCDAVHGDFNLHITLVRDIFRAGTGEPCTKMNSDINIFTLHILVAQKRWCIFHCDVPVMFSLCLLHSIVLLVFIALSQPIQTITIVRYPNRAKIHECVIVNHARQGPSPPSLLSPLISLNPGTAAPGFSSLWTKGDGWTWGGICDACAIFFYLLKVTWWEIKA